MWSKAVNKELILIRPCMADMTKSPRTNQPTPPDPQGIVPNSTKQWNWGTQAGKGSGGGWGGREPQELSQLAKWGAQVKGTLTLASLTPGGFSTLHTVCWPACMPGCSPSSQSRSLTSNCSLQEIALFRKLKNKHFEVLSSLLETKKMAGMWSMCKLWEIHVSSILQTAFIFLVDFENLRLHQFCIMLTSWSLELKTSLILHLTDQMFFVCLFVFSLLLSVLKLPWFSAFCSVEYGIKRAKNQCLLNLLLNEIQHCNVYRCQDSPSFQLRPQKWTLVYSYSRRFCCCWPFGLSSNQKN